MGCLGEPLPRMVVGRVWRAIGAPRAPDERLVWWRTARHHDPHFAYVEGDAPEATRAAWATLDAGPLVAVGLGEGWRLDGRQGTHLEVSGGRHLLQRGAHASWVDGAALPALVAVPPSGPKVPLQDPGPVVLDCHRAPPAKRPLQVGGLLALAGGTALLLRAAGPRGDGATTLGGAALLATGAGATTFGVLLGAR